MVAMPTVTRAAVMPSTNSERVLYSSWLNTSRPNGSVPSGCFQLGGAGCSTWSNEYPVTGSYVARSHTVAIRMGWESAIRAKTTMVNSENMPTRLSMKMPQPLANDRPARRSLVST